MAVVHREANSGAISALVEQADSATSPNAELPTIISAKPIRDAEPPTIEIRVAIAEARDVTVVAVTADDELRGVLTELLPSDGLIFCDTAEQALRRAAPSNCAILIVEKGVSRPLFEQLKSHFGATVPAIVSIMVGSGDDGSSLIRLLSAGHIDRFMVKPFNLGPTRSALRSALQQFRSTRARGQDEELAKPNVVAIESARDHAPNAQGTKRRSAQSAHSDKSDNRRRERKHIAAVTREPIKKSRAADVMMPVRAVRESVRDNVPDLLVESPTKFGTRAAASRQQLSLPAWSLALAAVIAMLGFVAWAISTRAPELNAGKTIAGHLAAAHRAFAMGSLVDPPELSAAHFYSAALDLDSKNVTAKRGLEEIADRLIANAKELIVAGDLLRAQSVLDNVRRIQPDQPELTNATALLLRARDAERLAIQSAQSAAEVSIETIAVSQALSVQPAPTVVAKNTGLIDPKIKIAPQRRERQLQAAVAGGNAVASLIKSPETSRTQSQVDLASAAQKSPLDQSSLQVATRTESARPREDVQDEVAHRVAPIATSAPAKNPIEQSATIEANPIGARPSNTVGEPTLIKYVEPAYPYKARASNAEGWLDVYFLVTSDGRVVSPRVGEGTLGNDFRRAAVAAVSQWKYSPSPNTSTPNRPMNVRLRFRLEG